MHFNYFWYLKFDQDQCCPTWDPNALFEIQRETKKYSINGADEIQLLFSANKGVKPQSLKQVASGGEFSRLMFTIKYL